MAEKEQEGFADSNEDTLWNHEGRIYSINIVIYLVTEIN